MSLAKRVFVPARDLFDLDGLGFSLCWFLSHDISYAV